MVQTSAQPMSELRELQGGDQRSGDAVPGVTAWRFNGKEQAG